MALYNIIAEQEEYTVVSEYEAEYGRSDKYQSEAMLEKDFIKTLTEQGYEYLSGLTATTRLSLTSLHHKPRPAVKGLP